MRLQSELFIFIPNWLVDIYYQRVLLNTYFLEDNGDTNYCRLKEISWLFHMACLLL